MKTIKQWFEPYEWGELALSYTNNPEMKVPSIGGALVSAFAWDKTAEGNDFWYHLYLEFR